MTSEFKALQQKYDDCCRKNSKFQKENSQLKEEIRQLKALVNEKTGEHVDQAQKITSLEYEIYELKNENASLIAVRDKYVKRHEKDTILIQVLQEKKSNPLKGQQVKQKNVQQSQEDFQHALELHQQDLRKTQEQIDQGQNTTGRKRKAVVRLDPSLERTRDRVGFHTGELTMTSSSSSSYSPKNAVGDIAKISDILKDLDKELKKYEQKLKMAVDDDDKKHYEKKLDIEKRK